MIQKKTLIFSIARILTFFIFSPIQANTILNIGIICRSLHQSYLFLKQGVNAHNFVETYYTDKSNRQMSGLREVNQDKIEH